MKLAETFRHPIGKLRVLGAIEGASFVALVGVGMPLKYWYDTPIFVRALGPVHGVLFVWLCIEIAQAVFGKGWPIKRGALVFAAALFPLGPFLIERWLRNQQREFSSVGS